MLFHALGVNNREQREIMSLHNRTAYVHFDTLQNTASIILMGLSRRVT